MANHKCSIYVRNTSGDRKRYPAGPNVAYPAGTTFQLRFKRSWQTLAVASYAEAVIAAKRKELELFQTDSENYVHKTASLKILPKPAFQETLAAPVPEPPEPVTKDGLGKAMQDYLAQLTVEGAKGSVGMYQSVFRQFYASAMQNGMVSRSLKSICKADLIKFAAYWKFKGQKDVTVRNKVVVIACLLKANGIHDVKLKINYEAKDVTAYSHPQKSNSCSPSPRQRNA
jgi:hypothetical protein